MRWLACLICLLALMVGGFARQRLVDTSWRLRGDTQTACVATKSPSGATGMMRRTHQRITLPCRNAATLRNCLLAKSMINLEFIVHLVSGAELVNVFQGARRPWRDRPCQGLQPMTRQRLALRRDLPVRTASLHAPSSPLIRAPHAYTGTQNFCRATTLYRH